MASNPIIVNKAAALFVLVLLVLIGAYFLRLEPDSRAATQSVESAVPPIDAMAAEDSLAGPANNAQTDASPECPVYSGPNDPRKSYGEVQNELQSAIVSLQGSGSPMHWLAASILLADTESERALEMLQNLLRTEATSAVAAWRMRPGAMPRR